MNSDKCIIFDMDGVLINSEPLHFEFESKLFSSLGITVPIKIHHTFVGTSSKSMWTTVKNTFALTHTVPELIQTEGKGFLEFLKSRISLYPITGVNDLLSRLKDSGFRLALASSSPMDQINFIMNKCSLNNYFPVRIGGDNVIKGKPDPEIFLKAAELSKVSPENCLVIEDSNNGVNAAMQAGMKCIGYINPDSGDQDISAANLIIKSFDRLTVAAIEELLI